MPSVCSGSELAEELEELEELDEEELDELAELEAGWSSLRGRGHRRHRLRSRSTGWRLQGQGLPWYRRQCAGIWIANA